MFSRLKLKKSKKRTAKKISEEILAPQIDSIFYGDQPIQRSEDDLFGRSAFAKNIAESIAAMPGPDPFVYGLSGPWGSGKTSLLNMIEDELNRFKEGNNKVIVFRFNPWWFSDSDALLITFLRGLARVLRAKIKGEASKRLADYMSAFGFLLKPAMFVPGLNVPTMAFAELAASGSKALKKAGELASQDVTALRRDINQLLLEKQQPVLVIADDVDRLLPMEVIQIFQIVKAIADFPFVRYLIAYDDVQVCSMIKTALMIEGRKFLEKVIQMPIELPPITKYRLHRFFLDGINRIISGTPEYLVDSTRFGNAFHDGIAPFLISPRDVKRLLNILAATYPCLKGEVELADFVAIQTVMVFAPEVYRLLRNELHWFIEEKDKGSEGEVQLFLGRWKAVCGPERTDSLTGLMKRTFPRFDTLMGGPGYANDFEPKWSSRKQVASERHFSKYFQMILAEGAVSASELAIFLDHLTDPAATDAWLLGHLRVKGTSDEATRVAEALTALNDLAQSKGRLSDEQRSRLLESLLRVGDELSGIEDAEFVMGSIRIKNEDRLIWVLRGLIEGIRESLKRSTALRESYKQGKAYFTMLDLARFLGSEQGLFDGGRERGQLALVDKDTCLALANLAIDRIKVAKDKGLLDLITDPLKLDSLWARLGDKDEAIAWVRATSQPDERFLLIIREAVSEGFSGLMTDRVARRSLHIAIEYLCNFFDSKSLRERAEALVKKQSLRETLDDKTIFGFDQISKRIRNDGTIVPERNNIEDD